MRPAFKRYLIATPPPVLVIHLKRFQQLSKAPLMSFSSGFKKLEDFVAFPECLDIGPFIAPRKEDFGLRKGGSLKRAGPCMYRLYAVVVHIGNMLGGHYVAYTALPTPSPIGQSPSPDPSAPGISTSSSNGPHISGSGNLEQNVPRKWAYISDTVVRLATLEEVLKAKAYICMYERL
jgi:ubiquitin C-terminal hydrolase